MLHLHLHKEGKEGGINPFMPFEDYPHYIFEVPVEASVQPSGLLQGERTDALSRGGGNKNHQAEIHTWLAGGV